MGINKNFVVKNGLEVDENLIYADGVSNKVGIGTTDPLATLDVSGNVRIRTTLGVDSSATLNDTLEVVGITSLGSTLEVDGPTILNDTLEVVGITSLGSTLEVDGPTILNDTLEVAGITNLNNDLNVVGITSLGSTLEVDGETNINDNLNVTLDVTARDYYGDGINLVGIVTQIVPSIGINIQSTQEPGKGVVTIDAYRPVGKTIYVSQTGDDNNTGLAENHPKRTIKAAAAVATFGDTIKVFPGVYVEENPIVLAKTVSVEGTELRNCVITPKFPNLDLFYVNNGCHITDVSFIGQPMTNGSSIVALQPLLGTAADRFFDGARMIRLNLDYIAREAVGFLTSGFSGFAGNHREQDAARLIDLNIDYIASEAVGFLTSPTGYNFTVPLPGTTEDCADDIRDIFRAVSYDLKANSNKKSVGAALSYFNNSGALVHITGVGVSQATIATLNYAVGIAKSVINNVTPPISYQSGIGSVLQVIDPSVIAVQGGCVAVGNTISQLVGIITSSIGAGNTSTLPPIKFGVMLEPDACVKDLKNIWKGVCFDITRGGNFRSVKSGKAYYDENWNLNSSILKNPREVEQTIATVNYSFDIARSVINNCTWGGYPSGIKTDVVNALYDNTTGIVTITASNHGITADEVLLGTAAVKVAGLGFTCPSGPGIVTYPSGTYGYVFPVREVVGINTFVIAVGPSTLPHTYNSGGTIQKYGNFQNQFTQVKDLSMQVDYETGFNDTINSCANVVSAIHSCVGVVTSIVGLGSTAFATVGFNTTYPGNAGIGFTTVVKIIDADYDEISGKVTIDAPGLLLKRGDIIEIRDLLFSCSSGGSPSTQLFPSGANGFEFYVDKINGDDTFILNVGVSTIPHTYVGGGVVINRSVGVSTASYDHTTGICTITAPGSHIVTGDVVTLRDLEFSCSSGGSPSTQLFPSGANGFTFSVIDIINDKKVAITSAVYDNNTGIATITSPGIAITTGEIVRIKDLLFSCSSGGSPSTQLFPSGKFGYKFPVVDMVDSDTFVINVGTSGIGHTYVSGGTASNVTERTNDTFTVNVGVSTLPHAYQSGGVILPPYSKGVGPITQGPYVRNCTNFVGDSIGMKVDGFAAEPGDTDDIGVTGTMSVDSYTQYNQGGIGVSITNGAYAQLVSIFTICNDIAIFTGSGGQCDITNSNSSFGRLGLVADGVGGNTSKSIYRYSGIVNENAEVETDTVVVSGLGTYRPYDGQAIYFGELFYTVQRIIVDDPGDGYSELNPPIVTIDAPPQDAFGIRAEASPNVVNGKVVSIDVISTGSQYRVSPNVTIADPLPGPNARKATARTEIYPTYYTIESATEPVVGVSTIVLNTVLNNNVLKGTPVYFNRLSLQITSSHSFEWVGSGNDIFKAKPALGGVTVQENEVVKLNGGECVYTSTDQAGNFRIGEGLVINQLNGTISGRSFSQSLLATTTPLILALSK
jgi:hypothetical protein